MGAVMIEVSGIKIALDGLDGSDGAELRAVRGAVLRMLRLAPDDLASLEPRKRSIDARKKSDVHLTYTVRVSLRGGVNAERALLAKARKRRAGKQLKQVDDQPFGWPQASTSTGSRPVVVGAGCAGLFCALALAEAGLSPLLVERGDDATRAHGRHRAVQPDGRARPREQHPVWPWRGRHLLGR